MHESKRSEKTRRGFESLRFSCLAANSIDKEENDSQAKNSNSVSSQFCRILGENCAHRRFYFFVIQSPESGLIE